MLEFVFVFARDEMPPQHRPGKLGSSGSKGKRPESYFLQSSALRTKLRTKATLRLLLAALQRRLSVSSLYFICFGASVATNRDETEAMLAASRHRNLICRVKA
jgi:hypothetical protein